MVANHVDSSPEKEKQKHFVVVSSRLATSNKKQQQQTSPNNNNKVPTYITQLSSPSSLPSSYKKPSPISSFTYIYPYLIYPSTFTVYTLLILPRQNPFRSSFNNIQYSTAHQHHTEIVVFELASERYGTFEYDSQSKLSPVSRYKDHQGLCYESSYKSYLSGLTRTGRTIPGPETAILSAL